MLLRRRITRKFLPAADVGEPSLPSTDSSVGDGSTRWAAFAGDCIPAAVKFCSDRHKNGIFIRGAAGPRRRTATTAATAAFRRKLFAYSPPSPTTGMVSSTEWISNFKKGQPHEFPFKFLEKMQSGSRRLAAASATTSIKAACKKAIRRRLRCYARVVTRVEVSGASIATRRQRRRAATLTESSVNCCVAPATLEFLPPSRSDTYVESYNFGRRRVTSPTCAAAAAINPETFESLSPTNVGDPKRSSSDLSSSSSGVAAVVNSAAAKDTAFCLESNAIAPLSDGARSICFFDLDDTLIPTEWIRRAYVTAKVELDREAALNGKVRDTSNLERDVIQRVRTHLDRLFPANKGHGLESYVCRLMYEATDLFEVVALVTNARSSAWLKIVSALFPHFFQELRTLGIPVLRAALSGESGVASPPLFRELNEYFDYWSGLKLLQFSRMMEAASRYSSPASTSSCLSLSSRNAGGESVSSKGLGVPSSRAVDEPSKTKDNAATCYDEEDFQSCGGRADSKEKLNVNGPPWKNSTDVISRKVAEMLMSADSMGKPLTDKNLRLLVGYQKAHRCLPSSGHRGQPSLSGLDAPFSRRGSFALRSDISTGLSSSMSSNSIAGSAGDMAACPFFMDVVSVGDSEFELAAARQLAQEHSGTIRGLGLVRCRAGFPPDIFVGQLNVIRNCLKWVKGCQNNPALLSDLRQFPPVVCEWTTRNAAFSTRLLGNRK